MKRRPVRTTAVISARQRKSRGKRVRFPLIRSTGPKVKLTNEKMYEHVEFP